MLFTPHSVVGATIGILTGNPILGFFSGMGAHFLLDALPHVDQSSFYFTENKGAIWAGAKFDEEGFNNQKNGFLQNKRDWILLGLDVILAGSLVLLIMSSVPQNQAAVIFGALGGVAPDLIDVTPFWKKAFRRTAFGKAFHKLHHFLHWPLPARKWPLGFGIQLAIVLICLLLIK
jgi:hypothetical protein